MENENGKNEQEEQEIKLSMENGLETEIHAFREEKESNNDGNTKTSTSQSEKEKDKQSLDKGEEAKTNSPINEIENDNHTTLTSQIFLNKSEIAIDNLNNTLPIMDKNKDPVLDVNKSRASALSENTVKESFATKTKKWAGGIWRTVTQINWKKFLAKPEYIECYDSAGNKIKVPKRKIPLKKQNPKITEEIKSVQFELKKQQYTASTFAFDATSYGSFFV